MTHRFQISFVLGIPAVLLFSFASPCTEAFSKSGNELCWEDHSPLTWLDFQGEPPAQTGNAAMTHIAIGFEMSSDKNVLVTNCMVKNKSWARPESRNAEILMHEQVHFTIAEVYARRMRQEMSSLNGKNPGKIKSIFNKWIRRYNKEQARYDKETKHSQNEAEQARWQGRVSRELKELDPYKETLVSFIP